MNRYAKIADKIVASFQETADKLSDVTRVINHVPGVESAMLDDYSMFRPEGKIRVELPVREWSEGFTDKKPMSFGIDPKMLVDRISAKLRAMGVKVMDVIYPEEISGFFGGLKGYDSENIVLEVSLA